ncbi:MAG: helix-turn-helix domain-containing protein [Acidimicrobiales bacterium]
MAGKSVFPGFSDISERRQRVVTDLVTARRRQGLSQAEVAARMGTSQPAVARLEAGDTDVRLSTIDRYAAAVGQELEWQVTSRER